MKKENAAVLETPTQTLLVCVHCDTEYTVEDQINPGEARTLTDTICFDGQSQCLGVLKEALEKSYFIAGSPERQSARDEKGKSVRVAEITNVCIRVDTLKPYSDLSADRHNFNGLIVKFVDNAYKTSSPVEQFLIEDRAAKNPGWLFSEEEWESAWLSPEERHEKRAARLQAEIEELKKKAGEV